MIVILLMNDEDVSMFEKIYNEHSAYMYKIAVKIFNNENDAYDCTQDAYLIVIKNIAKLSKMDADAAKSYIYRIVYSIAMNKIKRAKRIVVMAGEDLKRQQEQDMAEEQLNLMDIELTNSRIIEKALNIMNDNEKELVQLMYIHDRDYKIIALSLGVKEVTVRKRVERLRKKMDDYGVLLGKYD